MGGDFMKKVYFKDVAIKWLNYHKMLVKESTFASYSIIMDNYLIPLMGKYNINEIDNDVIQNLVIYLLEKGKKEPNIGLGENTVKNIISVLKICLKYAHKLGYKNVYILDPKTNIMEAIAMSDILVSEESSTMCEATIMGIPAISVTDWMIPDVTPSRFPVCNHPFTIKTKKAELRNCVKEVLENYEEYCNISKEYCKNNFSNVGNTAKIFMDIVDAIVEGKEISYQKLEKSKETIKITDSERKRFKKTLKHQYWHYKYIENYSGLRFLYQVYRKIKDNIGRKK